MDRPELLQNFLDTVLPIMAARAHDGDSPASLGRITSALRSTADAGGQPSTLPVCDVWLKPALDRTATDQDMQQVMDALRALSPLLPWRTRSVGPEASEHFPESHANAMLCGPGGIEHRHDVWLGVSLVAPNTRYPDHTHHPEETYLVLSPGEFRRNGTEWFSPGVGGSFFVTPDAVHAMRAGDEPLLALWALWDGTRVH